MSKQFQVFDIGGDVFTLSITTSDQHVLKSPYFSVDESIFLKESLRVRKIEISTGENLQVYSRTVYDAETMASAKFVEAGALKLHDLNVSRKGTKFVCFLHPYGDELTSSWCWIKCAFHLVKRSFNCLFIDLPGFNRSTVASNSRCPPSRWQSFDCEIIQGIMEKLRIPKIHFVAMGESAEIWLNCLTKIPKQLARSHLLVSPIFSEETLKNKFSVVNMSKLLLATSTNLLVLHDPLTYGDQNKTIASFRQLPTLKRFRELINAHSLLKDQITIGQLSTQDLQKVILSPSPDPGLSDVCGVLPSRYFLNYLTQFLINDSRMQGYDSTNLKGRIDELIEYRKIQIERMRKQDEIKQKNTGSSSDNMDKKDNGDGEENPKKNIIVGEDDALTKLVEEDAKKAQMKSMAGVGAGESEKEKRARLANWKQAKFIPEYSFGVRLLEQELEEETQKALEDSLEEYLEDLGDEEESYLECCKLSLEQLEKENNDLRIKELRNRPEVDPVEQLRDWQIVAEESYHQYNLENPSPDALDKALAISRKEVDLKSMLEEEEKKSRPNNAPAAMPNMANNIINSSTIYSSSTSNKKWKIDQAKEAAAIIKARLAAKEKEDEKILDHQDERKEYKTKDKRKDSNNNESGDEESSTTTLENIIAQETADKRKFYKKRSGLSFDDVSSGGGRPTGIISFDSSQQGRAVKKSGTTSTTSHRLAKIDRLIKSGQYRTKEGKELPTEGDAIRRAIANSTASYKRELHYDRFLRKNQPGDIIEEDDLVQVAIEASELTYEIEKSRKWEELRAIGERKEQEKRAKEEEERHLKEEEERHLQEANNKRKWC